MLFFVSAVIIEIWLLLLMLIKSLGNMVAASYGAEVKTRSVQWGRHCEIHREESQKSENPT